MGKRAAVILAEEVGEYVVVVEPAKDAGSVHVVVRKGRQDYVTLTTIAPPKTALRVGRLAAQALAGDYCPRCKT